MSVEALSTLVALTAIYIYQARVPPPLTSVAVTALAESKLSSNLYSSSTQMVSILDGAFPSSSNLKKATDWLVIQTATVRWWWYRGAYGMWEGGR